MSEKKEPNETTIDAIKEVEQMKTDSPGRSEYTSAEQMVEEILKEK